MKIRIPIKKLGKEVEIDHDAMPQSTRDYAIAYGYRQSLNDSIVSGATDAEREGLLAKRLDAMLNGTIGVRIIRTPVDPLAAEALRIARDLIRKKFPKADKDVVAEKAAEFAKDERIIALAKTRIDALAAVAVELEGEEDDSTNE